MKTVILLVTAVLSASTVLAQEPSDEFRLLDRNQDGKLTKDEVNNFPPAIDSDKDGTISVEEDQEFVHGKRVRLFAYSDLIQASFHIPYAATYDYRQRLHLYVPTTPKNDDPLPVVAVVNRGGGDRLDKLLAPLVESGEYAGVAIGSRFGNEEATWPATGEQVQRGEWVGVS